MGILKKLGIALLVILLVVLVAGYFLTRGDTADVAFEETVGDRPDARRTRRGKLPDGRDRRTGGLGRRRGAGLRQKGLP